MAIWTLLCILIGPHDSPHDRAVAAAIGAISVETQSLLSEIMYDGRFTGVVKSVDDRTLTVQGQFVHPFLKIEAEGTWSFKPSAVLRRNSFDREIRGYHHSYSYRFSDLKAKDHIDLRFNQYGAENVVIAISIQKRPGGLVPACPDTDGDERQFKQFGFKWHEWRNAHWDLIENGVPYPASFGEHRRFPAAPAPRPATQK